MNTIELKTELINTVLGKLQEKVTRQRTAMDDAQKEANSHKGAMASRYDTFKEEAQALRNGHARQLQEITDVLAPLEHLRPSHSNQVALGAVVVTDQARYFVSTGLIDETLTIGGADYECVSPAAPIMVQLRGKSKGATVSTPGGITTLLDIL